MSTDNFDWIFKTPKILLKAFNVFGVNRVFAAFAALELKLIHKFVSLIVINDNNRIYPIVAMARRYICSKIRLFGILEF